VSFDELFGLKGELGVITGAGGLCGAMSRALAAAGVKGGHG
jgi:hypothetical protein